MKNRSWEPHEAQDRLFCFFGGSWVRFVGHKRPTWPQHGSQDGAQIVEKSMPKWRPKFDASWRGILSDFFRFWEPTWFKNGGKLGIENALLLSLTEKVETLLLSLTEKVEHPKSNYFSNRILTSFGFG